MGDLALYNAAFDARLNQLQVTAFMTSYREPGMLDTVFSVGSIVAGGGGFTLKHIDAGTVPQGGTRLKWGDRFENRLRDLPGGQYHQSPHREYRVAPPPGTSNAGKRRIVVDGSSGAVYYTWTHYGDSGAPAFVRIR